jgi:uncharacterized RDD family membrane protein YckC
MEVVSSNYNYSSGAKRLLAFFIDRLMLHAIFSVIFFRWWGAPFGWDMDHLNFGFIHLGIKFWEYNLVVEALIVLYYSYMESSKYQATIGKLALGMKVTDVRQQPIDFSKALLRNLSKYLSQLILCIGYLMIIFDDRKQGLHDKIADTLVVNQ